MTFRWALITAAFLAVGAPALAGNTAAEETYDLLFRDGTLDELPRDKALVYERAVGNTLAPDMAENDTGLIELTFGGGDPEEALLQFMRNGQHRNLGAFPASVGNPIIMYYMETVVRDMAASTGGSPFYIRNRVKNALVQPAEISETEIDFEGRTVPAKVVTMHPFASDPNAERMQGFADLAMVVTMSEAVPGWYHSLAAITPDQTDSAVYSSIMTLQGTEAAQ